MLYNVGVTERVVRRASGRFKAPRHRAVGQLKINQPNKAHSDEEDVDTAEERSLDTLWARLKRDGHMCAECHGSGRFSFSRHRNRASQAYKLRNKAPAEIEGGDVVPVAPNKRRPASPAPAPGYGVVLVPCKKRRSDSPAPAPGYASRACILTAATTSSSKTMFMSCCARQASRFVRAGSC